MPAAVILAGGASRRLGGRRKAELRIGGRRLLDRVWEKLSGCDPLLISAGPAGSTISAPPETARIIFDLTEARVGPVGGLAAAVAALAALPRPPDLLVSAAVDTPFLPADFVRRLVDEIGAADAVVAGTDAQAYPTNAIWRLAALADLPQRLAAGSAPRALHALAEELSAGRCIWPATADDDPFSNVNTPDDLAALERRAATFDAR